MSVPRPITSAGLASNAGLARSGRTSSIVERYNAIRDKYSYVRDGLNADLTPDRASCLLRDSVASGVDKRRQLCPFVSDENGNQFGPIGVAGVGGYEMYRARRFKERLADIECLHRATFEL